MQMTSGIESISQHDWSSIQQASNRSQASSLESMSGKKQVNLPNSVEAAAEGFESVFVSLMLKEMRNTLDSSEGGLFAGEGSDTLGGMFDMFMSQHIAASKPLGIGKAVETYLKRSIDAIQPDKITSDEPRMQVDGSPDPDSLAKTNSPIELGE